MKRYSFTLLPALLACAACGEALPPNPDPAKLDALLAAMEPGDGNSGKTERLIGSVEKIAPERIDPRLAVAAITR